MKDGKKNIELLSNFIFPVIALAGAIVFFILGSIEEGIFILLCFILLLISKNLRNKLFEKNIQTINQHIGRIIHSFNTSEGNPEISDGSSSIKFQKEQLNLLETLIKDQTSEYNNKTNELNIKQKEISTQHKEITIAYEALKESQDRYEKLITSLEEEYFFYGRAISGEYLYLSQSVKKILGYTVSEFKRNVNSLFTDNTINIKAKENYINAQLGQVSPKFLVEMFAATKERRILEITEVPITNTNGEVVSIEGIAHNISERFYAEELIREQEEKYRQVFNTASDFILLYTVTKDKKPGKFIEVNKYTETNLGYTQEELKAISPDDLVAAEIWDESHNADKQGKYERIWETKEGGILNVEISERSFTFKNELVCIAVARDITDRKRVMDEIQFMNEELVNQKENLEALLDNLTQTQEQLVQSEKMAALGQLIAGVAHEVNTPLGAIKASVGNLSDSLQNAIGELPKLFQTQSKENLDLFLDTFAMANRPAPELSSREKREKKKEIRTYLREKNLASPEMLADLLVYLEIYEGFEPLVDLLHQEDALSVLRNVRSFISLTKNTKTISIAADKAAKVVFALKKYAHRDSLGEKVPTDIIDGIETVLTLYNSQLKQGIEVIKKYGEVPTVMCYQDEINQVWTNLIQNAIHAMGSSGELIVEAHSDEKSVYVAITDNGEGIEPTILDKIFDPFFTTKKQGEGSGLGLDIVKKIIDKHAGDIEVKSTMGEGTTFLIKIPQF